MAGPVPAPERAAHGHMRIPVLCYGPVVELSSGEHRSALASESSSDTKLTPAEAAARARRTITTAKLERHLAYIASSGFETPLVEDFVEGRVDSAQASRNVMLTFDGGEEAHYRLAFPLLKQYHLRATFLVPRDRLERPGGLTRGEIEILSKWGMGFGVLAPAAVELVSMLPLEVAAEVAEPRTALEAMTGRPVFLTAVAARQIEPALLRTLSGHGFRGMLLDYLGNHFVKDDVMIVSRYVYRRTVHPDEWRKAIQMSSTGPARRAFHVIAL